MAMSDSHDLFLTPEQLAFVEDCVATGRYLSAEDVVGTGLRMLQAREQDRQAQLAKLRCMIAEGAAELDRGEGYPVDEVFQEIAARRERLQSGRTNSA
jgi:putative addiction module CopG family antidote